MRSTPRRGAIPRERAFRRIARHLPAPLGPAVIFTGKLTDNDTDGSVISLNDVYTVFDDPAASTYFTVDNTFYNNVPGGLEGDDLDTYYLNSYCCGDPVFGVGIAPDTPVGTYTGTVDIDGSGGTNNAADLLFVAPITIVVAPEPVPFALGSTGLLAIAFYGVRRRLRG